MTDDHPKQDDLFPGDLAAYTPPESAPLAPMERAVLDALEAAWPGALTVREISSAINIDCWTVSPRLAPLARKGLVERAGRRSRQTTWRAKRTPPPIEAA